MKRIVHGRVRTQGGATTGHESRDRDWRFAGAAEDFYDICQWTHSFSACVRARFRADYDEIRLMAYRGSASLRV